MTKMPLLNKMEKQFKKILTKNKLLIGNSKYYSYDIVNSSELSQLNIREII